MGKQKQERPIKTSSHPGADVIYMSHLAGAALAGIAVWARMTGESRKGPENVLLRPFCAASCNT